MGTDRIAFQSAGAVPPQFRNRVPSPQTLADQFIVVINEWLSEEELAEVNKRNDGDGYAADLVCHTHDFCDANMAMDEAFRAIVGRSVDGENEDDCRLWNEAWALAKKQRFVWKDGAA